MQRSALIAGLLAVFVLWGASVSAGEWVSIELTDGSKIEGELLKKDAKVVHISVADTVLSLEREKIKEIRTTSGEQEQPKDVRKLKLYQTATGAVKSVSAHSEALGQAIVVVRTPSGMGTGWFCDPGGYIVTNQHVIANEQSITVTAFKREDGRFEKKVFKKVKLVALDANIDLALLHVEEELGMDIPQLYVGDSTILKEGDPVFTIGNPMGLERSTGEGIVSKTNRNLDGRLYIQTTAPIAPGNSGGPLFNERGEVIGVVNMGYIFLDGLGFAIPSKYVKEFLDNVEAFAFDPDNPNSGIKYMEPPLTATDGSLEFTDADFVKVGPGVSCLTLSDINGDGVKEVVFVNNNKGEIGILRRRQKDEPEEQTLDFEDINKVPDSERFKLVTHAVNNNISSLLVADRNGDGRLDIVFYGDVDGLCYVEQKQDGSFGPPRKIADFKVAKRIDALRAADFDGDGKEDIFALGTEEFTIFQEGHDRRVFPLNASYRDKIKEFDILDVNGDGRLDIVFFSADSFYAGHVLVQDPHGEFVQEELISSHISGPVEPCENGAAKRLFLTLDKGDNRVRELTLDLEEQPVREGRLNTAVEAVTLGAAPGVSDDFEIGDLDGDGRPEIVAGNKGKNEFVVMQVGDDGVGVLRSPAPRNVSDLAFVRLDDGRSALFSLSRDDKIFGVSRIGLTGVTFPRPINTQGVVEFVRLAKIDGEQPTLVWVEKRGDAYAAMTVPAAALAEKAFDEQKGSIDVEAVALRFGEDEANLKDSLPKKPERLAFADFNGDGHSDLVLYWSYSGKESLYLGHGNGTFTSVIVEQEFLEEQKDQPLLVADIDKDGTEDVLLAQPGFVRLLKVDEKNKLYVERQFNWEFDTVSRLIPYPGEGMPRFVALAGSQAKIVELDLNASEFRLIATIDLTGLDIGTIKLGDVDGNGAPDLLTLGQNALSIVYNKNEGMALQSRIVFDASQEYFNYWNIRPADLDGDGKDEVLLFDSKKAMFEIHRRQDDGTLRPICRQRLFEKTIGQRGETDSYELPQELAVGDMDGNGKADLIFILQDRIAIYLQGAAQQAGKGA